MVLLHICRNRCLSEEVLSTPFFQGMDILRHVKKLSVSLSFLFPGGRTQPASWCTNTWHQLQLLLPLPSIVKENSFLGSFPLEALIRSGGRCVHEALTKINKM